MSLTPVSSKMLRQFSGGITTDPGFGALLKMGVEVRFQLLCVFFLFWFLMVCCSGWYQRGKNETVNRSNELDFVMQTDFSEVA